METNRRAVLTCLTLGLGHAGLTKLAEGLGSSSMHDKTYRTHLTAITDKNAAVKDDLLTQARQKVMEYYRREEPNAFGDDGILNVGLLESVTMEPGQNLCATVGERLRQQNKTAYEEWLESHRTSGRCTRNYEGSSGGMEMGGALTMWRRSMDHGMRYTTFVGDGDTKTFSALAAAKPYETVAVEKEECVNHCWFKRAQQAGPVDPALHDRQQSTFLNANVALPPYVVYKAQNLWRSWCTGGPRGTCFGRSKSGWMDSVNFEEWFTSVVVPWARHRSGSKVMIGDNLSSHINRIVLEKCEQLDIKFVLLPPNSTDKCQPLDVSFFGPMKREWRKIMQCHKQKYPTSASLEKSFFPDLLSKLMENLGMRSKHNMRAGFQACGIYPLDESVVLKKFPRASGTSPTKVSEAVFQYLQKFKYSPNNEKPARVCRKKLSVAPGKSISAAELTAIAAVADGPTAGPSSSASSKETASPVSAAELTTTEPTAEMPPAGPSTSASTETAGELTSTDDSSDYVDSEEEWEPPKKKKSRNIFVDF
ncbi:tigger transposable element-derived protein 2 [Plakobranchus ocellatus]|uniref:Tigger transposable element-derived protein 2 n=1 Tax=Plakobranchus ocellatus TaxID=259542 RepID=A0AAV3ZSD8_9GAST|nr:tigger transposable element-derived protein 2 [Plakobranchus ocellatus]